MNSITQDIFFEETFKRAFVHPFATYNSYYLYDINTSSLIAVSKNIYKFYKDKSGNTLEKKDIEHLFALQKKGFLQENPIQKIEHGTTEHLEYQLQKKVQGVTLQVTQQCNLRCKYCVYSGEYITREHSSSTMSFDIAKKAVDFLIKHSSALDRINVSFYGGEPLLNFSLVKKVVEYLEHVGEGKKIIYGITTNGTLFTDEILDFLEKYEFNLLISMDGPKEIHDKNRIFKVNGKGSFDIIIKNIKHIKKNYPKVYKKISFNAVIDPSLDPSCVNEFFINSSEFDPTQVLSSVIADDFKKSEVKYSEEFFIQSRVDELVCYLEKLGKIKNIKLSSLVAAQFSQLKGIMFSLRNRKKRLPVTYHPSGPCIPGARKLFVTTEGRFIPCERVSESSDHSIIGSVDDGLYLDKISTLLNIGKITEESCKKCWGIQLCQQCYSTADDNGILSKKKRLQGCEQSLYSADKFLKDYCTLVELGYKFDNDDFFINTLEG